MSQVDLTINNRVYTVACDDGQEAQLQNLGSEIAKRVDQLVGAVGQVGEARLMLMAGLMFADELAEAKAQVERARQEGAAMATQNAENAGVAEDDTAELLDRLSERLETIAARLEAS